MENILIKGKKASLGSAVKWIVLIGGLIFLIIMIVFMYQYYGDYKWIKGDPYVRTSLNTSFLFIYAFQRGKAWKILLALIIISTAIALFFCWYYSKRELNVTEKHVYGCVSIRKSVDLPIDSVTSVSLGWLQSISISTSSGTVIFICIENREEIYKEISNLLLARQNG